MPCSSISISVKQCVPTATYSVSLALYVAIRNYIVRSPFYTYTQVQRTGALIDWIAVLDASFDFIPFNLFHSWLNTLMMPSRHSWCAFVCQKHNDKRWRWHRWGTLACMNPCLPDLAMRSHFINHEASMKETPGGSWRSLIVHDNEGDFIPKDVG